MEEAVAIDQVIQKNFSQLQKPGVLFVRPGYKATKGRVKDVRNMGDLIDFALTGAKVEHS